VPAGPIQWVVAVALAAFAALQPRPAEAKGVALLVGVSEYKDQGVPALEGPVNDVAALREVLLRRWGFAAADVRMLVDGQATKAAILRELAALLARSAPGDDVLIYLSGHGTSALDDSAGVPLPHGSGAFVPWDFEFGDAVQMTTRLVVGRTDLRPVLEPLDRGNRRVWVISDSCYSGQQVRAFAPEGAELPPPARMIPVARRPGDARARAAARAAAPEGRAAEPYPYRSTTFLAAAAEGERAVDIPRRQLSRLPTATGRAHGALTDALLRVLDGRLAADFNGDGLLDLVEVHRATADFMSERAYGHTPQRLPSVLEDERGLGQRPLLAARGVVAPPAALPTDEPLRVRTGRVGEDWPRGWLGLPGLRTQLEGGAFDVRLQPGGPGLLDVLTAGGDVVASVDGPERLRQLLQQLAWAKSLRQQARRGRRAVLPMEISPSEFGGNVVVGQQVRFVVRPDARAWLVLLNIDAEGRVTVLHPHLKSELQPLPAGQEQRVPAGKPIEVRLPVGMDFQFAFAFDSPPPGLESWVGAADMAPDDPRLQSLRHALASMAGRYAFASTELRTLAEPKQ
jgi:hypothetical protein